MSARRARVFDTFPFFNELDMLELRLEVLDGVVDRFVLVESTVTYSGLPKPLWYADHRSRFARWNDRIEHVVVGDTPDTGAWRWGREHHQRDAIARGLSGARCDDVVYVSDVDEIPDPEAIAARRRGAYHQGYYLYYLNTRHLSETWLGTIGLYAFQLAAVGAQAARYRRGGFERVERGGWHFTYAMSPDRIRTKLHAFSHDEYDTPEVAAAVETRRDGLADLFGRHADGLAVLDVETDYFPEHLKRNLGRYRHLVHPPPIGSPAAALGPAPAV